MHNRRQYDPFVVDSLVQRYPVPAASYADKCKAAQELHAKGWTFNELGEMFGYTSREVNRMINHEVEPLGELPDWALNTDSDYEWPRCAAGHELTPDNIRRRKDNPHWRACLQCARDGYHRRRNSDAMSA